MLLSGNAPATLNSYYPTGGSPEAAVTFDSDGNLYGTTESGGTSDQGTVFEIPKGRRSPITVVSFDGLNGAGPTAAVTFDSDGNLYGTTVYGGADNDGTVFEIPKGSTSLITVASFDGSTGAYPAAAVTFDSDGNLYGTTENGGADGGGTVFEIPKGSSSLTTLASFDGTNGDAPTTSVTFDSNGNLYGTTGNANAEYAGTVFEIPNGSMSLTTLATMAPTIGGDPSAVTFDSSGDLYGVTNSDYVFEIPKGSTSLKYTAFFYGPNGSTPHGSTPTGPLTLGPNGNLYGTTEYGGKGYLNQIYNSGYGTVFEIQPGQASSVGSTDVSTIASFNGANGSGPVAGVTFDSKGNLYGTTEYGGIGSGNGIVFQIRKGSHSISDIVKFNPGPVHPVLYESMSLPSGFVYLPGRMITVSFKNIGTTTGIGPFLVSLALSASEDGTDTFAAGPATVVSGNILPGQTRIAHVRVGPATGISPAESYYLVAQVVPGEEDPEESPAVSTSAVLSPPSLAAYVSKALRAKPGATVKLTIQLTNAGAGVSAGTLSDFEVLSPSLLAPITIPGTATFSIGSGSSYYLAHATTHYSFQSPTAAGTYYIYATITGAGGPVPIGYLTVLA